MDENFYRTIRFRIRISVANALIVGGVIMQAINLTMSHRPYLGPSGRMWALAWLLATAGFLLWPRRFTTGLLAGFCFAMALPTAFNQLIRYLM